MSQVRITARFDERDTARTGLAFGAVAEAVEGATPDDARMWVKCPEIERRRRNTGRKEERRASEARRLFSPGYTTLGAGEFEGL